MKLMIGHDEGNFQLKKYCTTLAINLFSFGWKNNPFSDSADSYIEFLFHSLQPNQFHICFICT